MSIRFAIFWVILGYYLLDLIFVKNPTHVAILALFKGERFDIVSVWGLNALPTS